MYEQCTYSYSFFIFRLSIEEYLDKYDCPANTDKLSMVRQWAQNGEDLTKTSENEKTGTSRSRSRSKDSRNTNEETTNKSCTDEGSNGETRLLFTTQDNEESSIPQQSPGLSPSSHVTVMMQLRSLQQSLWLKNGIQYENKGNYASALY